MNKNKLYLGNRNLIKWYEYTMDNNEASEDDIMVDESTEDSDSTELSKEEEERIALENSGLDDADKALVEDIMLRFQQASQDRVDSVFESLGEDSSAGEELSEDELIASLCKPKQNIVDALVNQARNE